MTEVENKMSKEKTTDKKTEQHISELSLEDMLFLHAIENQTIREQIIGVLGVCE